MPPLEPPAVSVAAPVAPVAVNVPPAVAEPEPAILPTAPAPDLPPVALEPPPVVATAPTAPMPPAEPAAAAAPATSLPAAAAPLDFALLGTRLRETKTIGVLTKLAVKNQVDALLEQFRAYHRRQGKATLSELHNSYDTLLIKVLSLFQDTDPPLARDIAESRTAIWDILADPRKFTESNLMAGTKL